MTKITKKINRLSERASQIRQILETAPAKAAELRGAVTAAAGQVQQVRSELKAGVAGAASTLRGSDVVPTVPEGRTARTMRALEAAAEVLKETGYLLDGIELEASTGRVQARLWRAEEVKLEDLRAALELYAKTPVEKALVSGLVQATEQAEVAGLSSFELDEVLVDADTGKAVQVSWRKKEETASPGARTSTPPPLPGAASNEPRPPVFAQSNFFERPAAADRTVPPSPVATPARAEAPLEAATPTAPAKPAASNQWRSSALDRFKKMPDLSKKAGA